MSTIRAVFFDVGETLIDETRQWGGWADWLQVPHLPFFAALGATIERGQHHQQVFEMFRPGFDLAREQAAREQAGVSFHFDQDDLYSDVRMCLETLHERGYMIGLAGNQPARAEAVLHALALPVDVVASSASWVLRNRPRLFSPISWKRLEWQLRRLPTL
ncbi:MAG: hypothetical protein AVDCRST_MAG93-6671, partial [uncultured Chloroflexia bacterium]